MRGSRGWTAGVLYANVMAVKPQSTGHSLVDFLRNFYIDRIFVSCPVYPKAKLSGSNDYARRSSKVACVGRNLRMHCGNFQRGRIIV